MPFWKKTKQETQAPEGKQSLQPDELVAEKMRLGLSNVQNVIAVASGKGGVGKSTVSTNLAMALQYMGASVGLLDADIYGPSQPRLLGAREEELQTTKEGALLPSLCYGMRFVSMGNLVSRDQAIVWRAPMAMKMIHQFLQNVQWGYLDFLIIDLPPGTGDVQLTLAQQASLDGAVIVSTPQDLALDISRRGLEMFRQVRVPILGMIENMSGFECPHCKNSTQIFGKDGARLLADKLDVPFLGSIPLDPDILNHGEKGIPVVAENPESSSSRAYLQLAESLRNELSRQKGVSVSEPLEMDLNSDGELQIQWKDGHHGMHRPYHLRVFCRCAGCIDEMTGQPILDRSKVPLSIEVKRFSKVGRYALSIAFNDGHDTGIYAYDRLRKMCECALCREQRDQNKAQASSSDSQLEFEV